LVVEVTGSKDDPLLATLDEEKCDYHRKEEHGRIQTSKAMWEVAF
jgi:hypothetical protein